MGCACKKGNKNVNTVSDAKVNALNHSVAVEDVNINNMARMVNFEGQLVPHNSIPQGSLFIEGVWYSSADTMPTEVREVYDGLLGGANSDTASNSTTD